MPPKRERASAQGLLPLMEARPWRNGKTITYRYHPIGGKPTRQQPPACTSAAGFPSGSLY